MTVSSWTVTLTQHSLLSSQTETHSVSESVGERDSSTLDYSVESQSVTHSLVSVTVDWSVTH